MMNAIQVLVITAALLSGCQTADEALNAATAPAALSDPAASAIAGDIASRLAEQIGPAGTTIIKMDKSASKFAVALKAALKGWGYTVGPDQKVRKDGKPVEIAYSMDDFEGQVFARVSTPSILLGRAYTVTAEGATPASALSLMKRN